MKKFQKPNIDKSSSKDIETEEEGTIDFSQYSLLNISDQRVQEEEEKGDDSSSDDEENSTPKSEQSQKIPGAKKEDSSDDEEESDSEDNQDQFTFQEK